MTKTDLIQALSQVSFCAIPTLITEDVGLQYDYITPEGAGASLGNMGEWPAFKLHNIPRERWIELKNKVTNDVLTEADLEGTELGVLFENLHYAYGELYNRFYPSVSSLFKGILSLPDDLPEYFFCRFDCGSWGDKPVFFADEKSFLEDFKAYYCEYITKWEDMSVDELQNWLDRTNDDLDMFPYNVFSEEEEFL